MSSCYLNDLKSITVKSGGTMLVVTTQLEQ